MTAYLPAYYPHLPSPAATDFSSPQDRSMLRGVLERVRRSRSSSTVVSDVDEASR